MTKTPYDTPKGQDNSLIGEISPGIYAHKHAGHYFARGAGFTTKAYDRILQEIKEDRLVFFAFSGPPGMGKTFFALRLAELLDSKFHITDSPAPPPEKDNGQVAFDREHLNHLLGPDSKLKEYQCVVVDESHFGLGARSWQKSVQQDVVNLLVACRSKRIIFMVVCLNMQQIDKYLRDYVVNYQFTLEDRGCATLYRRYFHKLSGDPLVERLGVWRLPLPWVDWCPNPDCIGCLYLFEEKNDEGIRCPNPRAKYERRKLEFLNKQTRGEVDGQPTRKTDNEIANELLVNHIEHIPRKKRDNHGQTIYRGKLKNTVKETLDLKIDRNRCSGIADIIERSDIWRSYIGENP